jgi:hypothetical protein
MCSRVTRVKGERDIALQRLPSCIMQVEHATRTQIQKESAGIARHMKVADVLIRGIKDRQRPGSSQSWAERRNC